MRWYHIGGYILTIITIVFLIGYSGYRVSTDIHGDEYKKGQIDAINGIIKYELVEHEDMTRTWELIENVDTD